MATSFFKGTRVVITGSAGTVGQELVCQVLATPVAEVRALDNNESALFFLGENYRNEPRLQIFMADVRDTEKMQRMLHGVDFVFHAAALKHVPLCERSPFDAVQTNIMGVENIIRASLTNKVRKVLFTSSDKAVNPTNVMGTSKLMGERLMTAANALTEGDNGPAFASTRFGNVAGSRGSVIPLFHQQIKEKGPVTLTDSRMTRFVMTLSEAVELVLESMRLSIGGEVFVTKMPVLNIKDMAEVMVEMTAPLYGHEPSEITIQEIGPRPGEKAYEELMNEEEIRRSVELPDFFSISPAFKNIYGEVEYVYNGSKGKAVHKPYHSANELPMSKDEIRDFLLRPGIFEERVRRRLLEDRN
jgi:FlaA1/EpsC-like NDP-sugar epimerase